MNVNVNSGTIDIALLVLVVFFLLSPFFVCLFVCLFACLLACLLCFVHVLEAFLVFLKMARSNSSEIYTDLLCPYALIAYKSGDISRIRFLLPVWEFPIVINACIFVSVRCQDTSFDFIFLVRNDNKDNNLIDELFILCSFKTCLTRFHVLDTYILNSLLDVTNPFDDRKRFCLEQRRSSIFPVRG